MKKLIAITLIYAILGVSFPLQAVLAQSPFGSPPQNPQNPGNPTVPGSGATPGDPTNPGNPGDINNPTSTGPTGPIENPTNPGPATDPTTGTNAGTGLPAGTAIDPTTGLPVTGNGLIPQSTSINSYLGVGRPNGPGYALYAGGGNKQNFWDYLKNLLSLDGQDNQSTYMNQETLVQQSDGNVVPYEVGTTPKTVVVKNTGDGGFSCKRDTSNTTINGYINLAICLALVIIPIIISAIVLWFMFGAVRILGDNKTENRNEYKQFLGWGLFIIFIALSFVGIIALLSKTLGL